MLGRLLYRAQQPTLQPVSAPLAWSPLSASATYELAPVPTDDEALDLAVIGGFIGIVSSLVSQMPLNAYIGTEQVDTPPILRNPAPGANRVLLDFVNELIIDLTLHGNYLGVLGDPSWTGWPDFLYPVPWGQYAADESPETYGWYRVGGTLYAPNEIFHIRVGAKTGQLLGRGLMERHPMLVASSVSAEVYAMRFFDSGATPPAQVAYPDPDMTLEQAVALKSKYMTAARRREPVITPPNTVVTPLSNNAVEAQLTESRRWNAQNLAVAIGIPAPLLSLEGSGFTYRNIEALFDQFITTAVAGRYLAPLEQQLTLQCLPRGTVAKFDTTPILRPDLQERVTLAVAGLAGGVFTAAEARALVDLPPSDEPPPLEVPDV